MWSKHVARPVRRGAGLHRVGRLLPAILYRSFFPDLSGVIPNGNRRTHRERRVVPYLPEQFFGVVADVDNYKNFVPFCVDSRVVKVIDDNTMEAEMSVGFKVVRDACLRHAGRGRGGGAEDDGLTAAQFQAACADLAKEDDFAEFKKLADNDGLSSAVYSSLKYLMRRRLRRGLTSLKGSAGEEAKACLAMETRGVPEGALLEFAISVYMMVQASAEDRALYIFSILDTNGNKQLDRQELQAALLLYMKSLARVIPTVVAHELEDMGRLIDIDSEQVQEEIVSVVDELMHEVTAEIPRAVEQIFEELGVIEAGCISEDEWEGAWQNFPELLDMMSLRGLGKTAHWAAIVLDQVVANQQREGDGLPPPPPP
ncbi:conserved unknown protein [Ectocarpus siliculosus]|uniref:EF-hand domain-containing protein n=1 Tax=Ectocarpus siliculosus TaxID=2880 RepID=D8LFG9_ECTSI|nr:conserved unknown protein [Ectocarpus siliculosus]|eukprot:CBN79889.1 conserved unknown protein [Ectocarpus siliculosus]